MTLLLADGFGWLETKVHEHDSLPFQFASGQWAGQKYTGYGGDIEVIAHATGRKVITRNGSYGMQLMTKQLGGLTRLVVGCRLVCAGALGSGLATLIGFWDGSIDIGGLWIDSAGQITYREGVYNYGDIRATADIAATIPGDTYIEADITFHQSAGIVKIWVNGVLACNETGIDTIGQGWGGTPATETVSHLTFDGEAIYQNIGAGNGLTDIYIDTTTQYGDVKVETKACTVAGSESDWTPAASTNISQVDEIPADEDTTYVNSAVTGDRDAYKCAAMTGIGAIHGIVHQVRIRKEDANDGQIKIGVQVGGSEDQGSDRATGGTSYENVAEIFELNPDTGVDFLESELTSLELTVENTSV